MPSDLLTGLGRTLPDGEVAHLAPPDRAARSVIFDTETTGLSHRLGDRVIEIGAIELINDLPTGQHFHALINPERDIPPDATRVHGITARDVAGKPRFAEVADSVLAFFGDGKLIAHNAAFDFGFVNAELERLGRPRLDTARMVDSLALAKVRFPGMANSLDALCRRFAVDLTERTTHNALLDCRLLAAVYVELTGGKQRAMILADPSRAWPPPPAIVASTPGRTPRPILPSAAELAAHAEFVTRHLKAAAVWLLS